MAFVFVIGTKSKTSLALCVGMLAISNIYRALSDNTQKRAILLLMLGFGMVGFLALYIAYQPTIERLFAHPTRFTGRVSICQVVRSEEHSSELQSLMRISDAVFYLKKIITTT